MKFNIYFTIIAALITSSCNQKSKVSETNPMDNSKNGNPTKIEEWSNKPMQGLSTGTTKNPHTGNMMDKDHSKNRLVNKVKLSPGDIKKATGGYTIQELYTLKEKLNNTKVQIRGKVVKFLPSIMKRNWIHIQDGTGDENSYDLTITSSEEIAVGKVVLVNGTVRYDKDFGAGYKYKVIVEEAKLTTEK